MAVNPYPFITRAVREGLSATRALSEFRAGGGSVGNQLWYRAFSTIKTGITEFGSESTRPLNRRPIAGEIQQFEGMTSRGFIQQVMVRVQDRSTGDYTWKPYSRVATNLTSRQSVINDALAMFGSPENEENYDEIAIGAVYTGTWMGGGA